MTPPIPATGPVRPGRRALLKGLGALAVAPAALTALGGPSYAEEGQVDARGYETPAQPSCLADLIETGVVDRGDLVAG